MSSSLGSVANIVVDVEVPMNTDMTKIVQRFVD